MAIKLRISKTTSKFKEKIILKISIHCHIIMIGEYEVNALRNREV
jgi:hypothetical protein